MDSKANVKKAPTPKQAQAKIGTLLKGIDNSVVVIEKHQQNTKQSVAEIKKLITGLNSQPATKPAKAQKPAKAPKAPKPAKPTKEAKASAKMAAKHPAPKVALKPAKTPKEAKPAKAPKPAKAAKPAKAEADKGPVSGRPGLKDVLHELIHEANGEAVSAASLYRDAVAKWGYWSRQSLYNALKDTKSFKKQGVGFVNVKNGSTPKVSDSEAESFVDKAASQPETSALV